MSVLYARRLFGCLESALFSCVNKMVVTWFYLNDGMIGFILVLYHCELVKNTVCGT